MPHNGKNSSELIEAAKKGHTENVLDLLNNGCGTRANVGDKFGRNALMWAVYGNHKSLVEALLNFGVDVNAKDKSGRTALMLAAICGNACIMLILLDNGAGINEKDNGDKTALMVASMYGRTEVVELLEKAGATE